MATLEIPDQTLARLRAAAAARHVSVVAYLDQVAAMARASSSRTQFHKSSVAERIAAADSIQKLAAEIRGKSTIEVLIADKHAGHKY